MCRRSEAAQRLADSNKIVHVIFINGFETPPISIVQDISINKAEKRKFYNFTAVGLLSLMGKSEETK